jgi:hypothetical protein
MDPIPVSIAAAIAAKGAGNVYDLVKRRFGHQPEAHKALEAAEAAPSDPEVIRALAERLDVVRATDPEFGENLLAEWDKVPDADRVVNQISGPVTGKVVQAGEIHGNITF